jgi:hypothetical protein
MLDVSHWEEHFNHYEAEEIQPLFDPVNPIEHYCKIRNSLAIDGDAYDPKLKAPVGLYFPPTVLVRSLLKKETVPLITEWPGGIYPSVAIQCQLALLFALAGEIEKAKRLAEFLAPIVLGKYWTLWTLEKDYDENEVKLSSALFLQAIGMNNEADKLYTSSLPKSPFFAHLFHSKIKIEIDEAKKVPFQTIYWTLESSKASLGAIRLGQLNVLAMGPHGGPLNDSSLFGVSEAGSEWFSSLAQKEVWFQLDKLNETSFSIYTLGISFEKPLFFVFYVDALECRIGNKILKPKNLERFSGEATSLQFDGALIEIDRPLKIELIPLACNQSYWGASFLLAFSLSPISNKVFFRLQT